MLENHYPSRLRPLALSTVVFSSFTQTQFSSPYQPRHQASTLALTAHPRCQITDTPAIFQLPRELLGRGRYGDRKWLCCHSNSADYT